MADLTSTIRISGNIGGKVINYSHVFTVENVYDAGTRASQSAPSMVTTIESNGAGSGAPNFPQACPDYLFLKNGAFLGAMSMAVRSSTDDIDLYLGPKQFAVLAQMTSGGVFNINTTATTSTLLDVEDITPSDISGLGFRGIPSILVAFNSAS